MSMWRCPHCGTPQAETARCWVCHRSSTTCSTCRCFRRSVAAQVGFCGLDRRRLPLAGDEHRGCWEASGAQHSAPDPVVASVAGSAEPVQRRKFVPVDLVRDRDPLPIIVGAADGSAGAIVAAPDLRVVDPWVNRRTLFGELDR